MGNITLQYPGVRFEQEFEALAYKIGFNSVEIIQKPISGRNNVMKEEFILIITK